MNVDIEALKFEMDMPEHTFKFDDEWDLGVEIFNNKLTMTLQNYEGEIIVVRELDLITPNFLETCKRQILYHKFGKV